MVSFLPSEARQLRKEFFDLKAEAERLTETIEGGRTLLETLLENRFAGIELLADAWADYELARGAIDADELMRKSHPAYQSADVVRAKSKELAAMRRRAKVLEQVLKLYEWHIPWLSELRDLEAEESYSKLASVEGEHADDPVAGWLTPEEYAALKPAERNQRALDRYWKSRKSRWQIGRDYERYVGYLYEQEGYTVNVSITDRGEPKPPRRPFEIVAAVLALDSDWNPPFGDAFRQALQHKDPNRRLNLGCALRHGAFDATNDPDGAPSVEGASEGALMFLLMRLFARLQVIGSPMAIDLRAYSQPLKVEPASIASSES